MANVSDSNTFYDWNIFYKKGLPSKSRKSYSLKYYVQCLLLFLVCIIISAFYYGPDHLKVPLNQLHKTFKNSIPYQTILKRSSSEIVQYKGDSNVDESVHYVKLKDLQDSNEFFFGPGELLERFGKLLELT